MSNNIHSSTSQDNILDVDIVIPIGEALKQVSETDGFSCDDGTAEASGKNQGKETTIASRVPQSNLANKFFDGDEDLVFDPRQLAGSEEDQRGRYDVSVDIDGQPTKGKRHMSLANLSDTRFPTTLQFSDIEYSIAVGKGRKRTIKPILKRLSGEVRPGQVLAIMGASGAGKTTLLNMLAGRLSAAGSGQSRGTVLVNGKKRNFSTFRQISAFVLQQDSFFGTLTVRETITLSALLRLPRNMSKEEKLARVDSVIAELGLNKCQHTYVGNELTRGVSGGERKRVNVGTELVTNPSLVFLDEPTTGLDAFNAQNVMQTLLLLARSNRTIVATIHQPRSTIFQMFDYLMLLSEGNSVYFGPAHNAVRYFSSIGYLCPSEYNPADYFLDLISLDQRNPKAQAVTQKRIDFLTRKFNEHQRAHPVVTLPTHDDKSFEVAHKSFNHSSGSGAVTSTEATMKYNTSFGTQFWLLTHRSIKAMMREKVDNISRISQTILFAIILGIIWINEGNKTSSNSIQAVAGAMFFLLVNQSFGSIFGILFLFPVERAVVLKERASRSYHVGAYFWSKTAAETPRSFLLNLLFSIITYFMVGFRSGASHFFIYTVIVFLVSQTAEGIALIVSAIADDPQQAGAISPIFIVTSMLFGGFFIGVDQIPVWLSWLRYLSFLKYGFSSIMQNEFEDRDLNPQCLDTPLTNGGNSTINGERDDFCFVDGAAVLSYYNLDEVSMGVNLIVLLALIVAFRLIAYYILRRNGPVYDYSI